MINSPEATSARAVIELYVLDAGQIEILDWSQYDPAAAPNTRHVVADPACLVVHPSGTLHPHEHYDPAGYSALRGNRVIPLEGDHDVFGDGTVVIYRTPGHTVGSQSLLVDLAQEGPVLISGDLAHSLENWSARAVPAINHDAAESTRSLARMHALVAERGAQVWVQHDARQFSGLTKAPAVHR